MFEDWTTENLKKETLAEISPELGISTMAGSYADAVVGPLAGAGAPPLRRSCGTLSGP